MKYNEKIIMVETLLLSIAIMELFIFGGFGIAVPIYIAIYYGLMFFQCKNQEININIKENFLFIPILMISMCFLLFNNFLLKKLNFIFLYGLVILNTADIYNVNSYEKFSIEWFLNVFRMGFIYPFENLIKCFNTIGKELNNVSRNLLRLILKIIIGLIIGASTMAIILPLLMSSDMAFRSIIEIIFKNLDFNLVLSLLKRIVIISLIFFPIYSFLYGITHNGEIEKKNKDKIKSKKLDFTVVITVTTIVCLIYILFCLSQLAYFVSAFKGILPEDYTFAEYARKGFFECLPLSSINLIVVVLLEVYTNHKENIKKKKVIKGYITFIVAFTLFLVISSLSKMIMYISAYGLTIMRIYVAWFLILLSIVLTLICVKIYYDKLRLFKNIFIMFTIMFIGINYANIDYLIGSYNAKLYTEKQIDTISAFNNLSTSAIKPFMKISSAESDRTRYVLENYTEILDTEEKWQDFNISKYNAEKYLKANK